MFDDCFNSSASMAVSDPDIKAFKQRVEELLMAQPKTVERHPTHGLFVANWVVDTRDIDSAAIADMLRQTDLPLTALGIDRSKSFNVHSYSRMEEALKDQMASFRRERLQACMKFAVPGQPPAPEGAGL